MKGEGEDEGEGSTGKRERKGVQKIGSVSKGTKLKMC